MTSGAGELQKYTRDGVLIWRLAIPGSTMLDIALDFTRSIYVVSQDSNQILKFGYGAVPVVRQTWGQLKRLYR